MEYKRDADINYPLGINLTSIGQGIFPPTEFKVDNLQADTLYDIRVRPYNRLGVSYAPVSPNTDTIRLKTKKTGIS